MFVTKGGVYVRVRFKKLGEREGLHMSTLLICCQQRCHCNARFKPDLLCVKGLPYQSLPPTELNENLTIQSIEFTYSNDRIPNDTTTKKTSKYKPLIDNISNRGWKIDPLIVIIAGARAVTHIPSMKSIEVIFKIPKINIKHTFEEINVIAIQYAMSIILKRNVQPQEKHSAEEEHSAEDRRAAEDQQIAEGGARESL